MLAQVVVLPFANQIPVNVCRRVAGDGQSTSVPTAQVHSRFLTPFLFFFRSEPVDVISLVYSYLCVTLPLKYIFLKNEKSSLAALKIQQILIARLP